MRHLHGYAFRASRFRTNRRCRRVDVVVSHLKLLGRGPRGLRAEALEERLDLQDVGRRTQHGGPSGWDAG